MVGKRDWAVAKVRRIIGNMISYMKMHAMNILTQQTAT